MAPKEISVWRGRASRLTGRLHSPAEWKRDVVIHDYLDMRWAVAGVVLPNAAGDIVAQADVMATPRVA